MAKFSVQATKIHCKHLNGTATHLQQTCKQGIRHKLDPSTGPSLLNLADGDFNNPQMPSQDNLPPFPLLPDDPTIVCFVNAAHANIKPKRKSTTGHAFFLLGSTVVHRSKMQTHAALRSTEEISCCRVCSKNSTMPTFHTHRLALHPRMASNHL